MGRLKICVIMFLIFLIGGFAAQAQFGGRGNMGAAPDVRLSEPADDSTVDLTGRDSLTFSWGKHVIPAGGRQAFRFKLYSAADGSLLVEENLSYDVYSLDVPAGKFTDGQEYTWQVQQRDQSSMAWSNNIQWRFKVKK